MQGKPGASQNLTYPSMFVQGSNVIVAGTAIFGAEDPENVITTLKSTVNQAQEKIAAGA